LVYLKADLHPRVCHIECGKGLVKGDIMIKAQGEE